ncbi:hypothetical protein O1611_g443 [Lasiodiplodia mahajangana]|uniref:Uncharacterized protein n=1 Tax=Lasiodiplodia mahajangana TaxID=1108764 RepID=A0ACC2K0V1_9PEZI|nr:hypothetical protein O1611_g443 [Lasiodiplodia mahajangana]
MPKGKKKEEVKSADGPNEKTLRLETYTDSIGEWLRNEMPAVTKAQVKAICEGVIPKVGQEITATLQWLEEDIENVHQRADQIPDIEAEHEDTAGDKGAEVGPKLYKLCLRKWHRFPTEIICPSAGLVFCRDNEKPPLTTLISMDWSRSFNEALIDLVIHSAWGNDFYLMVYAIRFVCICRSDDRRPWKLEAYGDPFFEAFLACQRYKPDVPKSDLLEEVEKRLKRQRQWPSRVFQIFKSIARIVQPVSRDKDENDLEPYDLLQVRTADLSDLVRALDATITDTVVPFLPAEWQVRLFTSSREGGIYNAPDIPADKKTYQELRHTALKGLRANAIAYELAFDSEETILQYIPRHARVLPDDEEEDPDEAPTAPTASRKRPRTREKRQVSYSNKRFRSHGGTTRDTEDEQLPRELPVRQSRRDTAHTVKEEPRLIEPTVRQPLRDTMHLQLTEPIARPSAPTASGQPMAPFSTESGRTGQHPGNSTLDYRLATKSISGRQPILPIETMNHPTVGRKIPSRSVPDPSEQQGGSKRAANSGQETIITRHQDTSESATPMGSVLGRRLLGQGRDRSHPASGPYDIKDPSDNDADSRVKGDQETMTTSHQEGPKASDSAGSDLTGQSTGVQDPATEDDGDDGFLMTEEL